MELAAEGGAQAESLYGRDVRRGEESGARRQLHGVRVPMEEYKPRSILEGSKHRILAAGFRQLDGGEPDFLAVAKMQPRPESKRQELHSQAYPKHGNASADGLGQQAALRPQAGMALVVVCVLRSAHDDDAADFGQGRELGRGLVENRASNRRKDAVQRDVDESGCLPGCVGEDKNRAVDLSFVARTPSPVQVEPMPATVDEARAGQAGTRAPLGLVAVSRPER
jgi:hypothetical protein